MPNDEEAFVPPPFGKGFGSLLKEYCRHCEQDPRMLKQKEVYERSFRGETPNEIAAAMGISRGSVDVHNHRARKWVLNHIREKYTHDSGFPPIERDKPEEEPVSSEDELPTFRSFAEVLRWVIEETDALCPSHDRLAAYAENPNAPEFSDVRYHVEEAGCRLCRAELEQLRRETG